MNKVAQYLNEHILGQVVSSPATRRYFSTDLSILTYTPEIIAYPKVTNDIRKIARFAWQLAEKGHVLGITPRGSGSDKTGAAIGEGVLLSLTGYMDELFEVDIKQKLLRVQPGATVKSINDILRVHGMSVPSLVGLTPNTTIGGAIANNKRGTLSGKYGGTGRWTEQLEVVLSNGDVLQTERISKRELGKRKGKSSFEGELYRQIDNLISDNSELIVSKIADDTHDYTGYSSIADVKHKDGSFDLTPLFVGSQGTLGVISEMIMKADFVHRNQDVVVAVLESLDLARDAVDALRKLDPAYLDIYHHALFDHAAKSGKKYPIYTQLSSDHKSGAVLILGFDEFSERARSRKIKQATKLLRRMNATIKTAKNDEVVEALSLRDVTTSLMVCENEEDSAPPILDGAYVPLERLDGFAHAVAELATKHHVTLPLYGNALDEIYYTRPTLQLRKVGDKQKVFRLIDEYAKIVASHGGSFVAEGGEGRLKSAAAYDELDEEVIELYKKIKQIFDPYGILNPGVKQSNELKDLVAHLRPSYDMEHFANHVSVR